MYLEALPAPSKLGIQDGDKSSNAKQLLTILEAFNKTQEENTAKYGLTTPLVRMWVGLGGTVGGACEEVGGHRQVWPHNTPGEEVGGAWWDSGCGLGSTGHFIS